MTYPAGHIVSTDSLVLHSAVAMAAKIDAAGDEIEQDADSHSQSSMP
jgi:hypothetical protein